ncbi:hypothetical protein HanLR1_Chr08g0270521 [Helianthus annuus]|nr:hypothetical protein HanLR1_Chr08g0270521 [Helianthus annuus]
MFVKVVAVAMPSQVEVFVQCDGYGGGAVVGRVVIMVERWRQLDGGVGGSVGWWCWR